jgi:HEAT repeat protein
MDRVMKSETAREAAEMAVSVMALKKFQQPMIEYLSSGLEDNDKWVRVMAMLMLGAIGDSRSAELVKPLLADRDRDLRTAAARSLTMIHSPKEMFSLSQSGQCDDCLIRLVASEALEKLKEREIMGYVPGKEEKSGIPGEYAGACQDHGLPDPG